MIFLTEKEGMNENEIEMHMHYNIKWWSTCAHRSMLPPSLLHWRVRVVFVFYGDKKEVLTVKPLFNYGAWIKSKNML